MCTRHVHVSIVNTVHLGVHIHLHCSHQVHAQSFAQVCVLLSINSQFSTISGITTLKKVTRWDEVVSQ